MFLNERDPDSLTGNIGFSLTGLDIRQRPLSTGLGNQFEAENTIFGQEHVLGENVHAVDTLGPETIGDYEERERQTKNEEQ